MLANGTRLARPKGFGLECPCEKGWQERSGFSVLIGGSVRQGSEQGLWSRRHRPAISVSIILSHDDLVLSGVINLAPHALS